MERKNTAMLGNVNSRVNINIFPQISADFQFMHEILMTHFSHFSFHVYQIIWSCISDIRNTVRQPCKYQYE